MQHLLRCNMEMNVMATFWNTAAHAETPVVSLNFLARVGQVFTWIGERRAREATLRELQRMDERDLHDLRISPYDFNEIANGTYRR
jgi:uncharacterized protein YjiS (DUF1127 family)